MVTIVKISVTGVRYSPGLLARLTKPFSSGRGFFQSDTVKMKPLVATVALDPS